MPDALFMALWMGFLIAAVAFVGALLFWKAIQGDITFQEAAIAWIPLAACFLLLYISRGTVLSWLFGIAGVGYLAWIVLRRHQEEQQIEEDLVAQEIEKWGQAVEADPANGGAHLYLGHALVQRGDLDGAADHYRHALELDLNNVRELLMFLARRGDAEEREIRARLPDLERITRQVRERSAFGPAAASSPSPADLRAEREGAPPAGDTEETGSPFPPESGEEGGRQSASSTAPAGRVLFGYETDEERFADQERLGRLAELRKVVDDSPDDLFARQAYAAALAEAGYTERACEEYQLLLAADPDNQDAAEALARLTAMAPAETNEAPAADTAEATAGDDQTPPRFTRMARLRALLEAGESDVEARLAYAQALEEEGLSQDAYAQYRRILEREPEHPAAAAGVSRLEDSMPVGLQVPADTEERPFAPPERPQRAYGR